MPLRIPIQKLGTQEAICYSAASVTALAPLYLLMPGAEERLAKQTTKWAPRWEKNMKVFSPSFEKGIHRVEPPVAKTVRRLESRLPLERAALGLEKRIKSTIDRAGKHAHHKHASVTPTISTL